MPDCDLLDGGLERDCTPNIGGLFTTMWMTEKSNVTGLTRDGVTGIITAFTMTSPAVFYPFNFTKGSSSFTESQTFDAPTGNTLVTQTIVLTLNLREQLKRDKIVLLGNFKEMYIVCKDNNGNLFLFGETGGCTLTTNEGGSGTAKTDGNNYVLTFIGEESSIATEVSQAAIDAAV